MSKTRTHTNGMQVSLPTSNFRYRSDDPMLCTGPIMMDECFKTNVNKRTNRYELTVLEQI